MINTISVTAFKQDTKSILDKVKTSGEPMLILQRSKVAAVLIDPKQYNALEQFLEDRLDNEAIEQRKNEDTIPLESVAKKLGIT